MAFRAIQAGLVSYRAHGDDQTDGYYAHPNGPGEAELKRQGKNCEFHRYDGAGHAFNAWYRPNYRQEQAQDAWDRIFGFHGKHLGT